MNAEASKLGRLLIKQLDPKDNADLLTRWMAYYISELINKAEQAEGKEKEEINEKCANVIFELWKHRMFLPKEVNPLEEFTPILNTLKRIDPDSPRFFFEDNLTNEINGRNQKLTGINNGWRWWN